MTCRQTLAITSHRVLAGDLNEHETVWWTLTRNVRWYCLDPLQGSPSPLMSLLQWIKLTSLLHLDYKTLCIETYVSGCGNRSISIC